MPRKWTKEQKAELSRKMTGKKRPYARPVKTQPQQPMQSIWDEELRKGPGQFVIKPPSEPTDETNELPEIIIYEGAAYIPAKKRVKVI
jgi:hypothetical protein